MAPVKSTVVKKQKFIIDCSAPANDKIFDVAAFVSVKTSFCQWYGILTLFVWRV